MQDADLSSAKLQNTNFNHAQLQKAILSKAELSNAHLDSANLQGSDLKFAQFRRAYLNGAQLQGADLAPIEESYYSIFQLLEGNLKSAQLQGANLANAQLQGANLARAKLQGANLYNAELHGAYLNRAELQGTYLFNAKLQGADLSYAQLQGADLSDAQLNSAILYSCFLKNAGLDFDASADILISNNNSKEFPNQGEIVSWSKLIPDINLREAFLTRMNSKSSTFLAERINVNIDSLIKYRTQYFNPKVQVQTYFLRLQKTQQRNNFAKLNTKMAAYILQNHPQKFDEILNPYKNFVGFSEFKGPTTQFGFRILSNHLYLLPPKFSSEKYFIKECNLDH